MKCHKCGAELQENEFFCIKCGALTESITNQSYCINDDNQSNNDANVCSNCETAVTDNDNTSTDSTPPANTNVPQYKTPSSTDTDNKTITGEYHSSYVEKGSNHTIPTPINNPTTSNNTISNTYISNKTTPDQYQNVKPENDLIPALLTKLSIRPRHSFGSFIVIIAVVAFLVYFSFTTLKKIDDANHNAASSTQITDEYVIISVLDPTTTSAADPITSPVTDDITTTETEPITTAATAPITTTQ